VQSALESALADLVLGTALDPSDASAVGAWLDRHGVAEEDREALRQNANRLLIYRRLVRGSLWDALVVSMPRTVARLGGVLEEYFNRFLAERAPQTHYLRDVPRELLDFCEPLWAADDRVPDYMLDLANHEFLRIQIGALPNRPRPSESGALELDRAVCFIDAARLAQYAFRVHELSDDEADRREPQREHTELFVYRSPEHVVRYLELTPLAALILRGLMDGATLRAAITEASTALAVPLDDAVLNGTAKVLHDLAERGALLGATPAGGEPV
jgi:hypothetical protein